ncbi:MULTISPECIES: ABC transporter ATP-binding protein [Prochlorococcus]|uniref:ABC transporter ATP-binding protein n=1 Tax=Prochlorococcus TaxID=1218 RepID=UPI0007B35EE9|nr:MULTISPECIES: ATP-binding cassette domain-containing protein [Prochlorococcus]
MKDENPWLDINDVEAWLGPTQVFRNLSLKLEQGENTAILGPNGSGKTALVKLITRNIYPIVKRGSTLKIFGNKKIKLNQLRSRIGVVSTDLEVRTPDYISAKDVVLSGLYGSIGINRNRSPKEKEIKKVQDLISELGLEDIEARSFGQLSDGERRRLLIARAMINEPEVLILDEPTNGLDLKARHQLLKYIRILCTSKTTIILITHRVEDIVKEMQRIIFLKKGAIIRDGATKDLLLSEPLGKLYETPLEIIYANGYYQVIPG